MEADKRTKHAKAAMPDRPVATDKPRIPHEDITFRIIGAAMRVHNRLGPLLKEEQYQRAPGEELHADGLSVAEEYHIEVYDGDVWLGRLYVDLWVEEKVVVEIKALSQLTTADEVAQVINYLAATGAPVGVLINFGRKRLEYRRILPPKKFADWKAHIQRFLWKPDPRR